MPVLRYFAFVLFALLATPRAEADPAGLQRACFGPSDLAAKAGEERPVRKPHPYAPFVEPEMLAPAEPVLQALRGSIRRVDIASGEKLVALTLDICEQPGEIAGYDGQIFDLLRREGAKATLFVGGKWLQTHETRATQLLTDPLFEIANHSETHRNLRTADKKVRDGEITNPERAYERLRAKLSINQCVADMPDVMHAVPKRMRLFRFPYGACSPDSMAAVNDAGFLAIQRDISTGDPDPRVSAKSIAATIVRQTRPGSIIIAHANGRGWHTAEGLALAIPKLKAMGYTFVTVSELLAKGTPVTTARCFNAVPGDTDRYDTFAGLRRLKALPHMRKKTRVVRKADAEIP